MFSELVFVSGLVFTVKKDWVCGRLHQIQKGMIVGRVLKSARLFYAAKEKNARDFALLDFVL
ncbi:MAG: hypothetical protein V8Q79_09035 [Christensenellales bacterium]